MPWKPSDAQGHTKHADTPKKQELWAEIANDRLKVCKEKGGSDDDCEASAIRQANAVVERAGKEAAYEEWFSSLDEDTRQLIEDHEHGLKSALEKERKGRKEADRKLGEAEIWAEDIKGALKQALTDEAPPAKPHGYRYWIRDVSVDDSFFVYEDEEGGGIYKRAYSMQADGKVLLGAAEKVRISSTYMPIGEAGGDELLGDVIPLVEKAVASDGTIPIKIIQPGWGQSGFYSPGLLERDGPKVFTKGTQMFWDHPTESEERERPERSLRDLAAELTEDAKFVPDGAYGPGLYARAKVFDAFGGAVNELAPHIGLSINASGKAEAGEAEGRKGPIIKEITGRRSVDFVTVPGAGGQVLELFEAARGKLPQQSTQEGTMPDENALKEAQDALVAAEKAQSELETENARLKEAILLGKAKSFVSGKLAGMEMPDLTRARLTESLSKNPIVKEGELDEAAMEKAITEAVKAEVEYLSKVTGSGKIEGLGEAEHTDPEGDPKKLRESYIDYFESRGIAHDQAEKMADEAMKGR